MAAAPEREMLDVLPREVERVRVGKARRIAVGGAENHDHTFSFANRLAAQLDVGSSPPVQRPLDRAVVAQELLDRV